CSSNLDLQKGGVGKQLLEFLKSHKLGFKHAERRFVILKRNHPAAERQIVKDHSVDHEDRCPEHQNLLTFKFLPVEFCFHPFLFRSEERRVGKELCRRSG